MPCLGADFALLHASRSRGSPIERVNLRRAVRHSRCRTDNWSFHQYIESSVRPCPRRGIECSHAAITFRRAACTVEATSQKTLSNQAHQDSSRCFCSLSLLSRLVLQEALVVTQSYYLEDAPVAYR